MLPLPVQSLISHFNVGPLSLYRQAAPVQTAFGDYADPVETLITIDPIFSHVAPAEDLQQLPEADRSKETRRFGATVALQVGDRLVHQGRAYRLVQVEDRQADGGVYLALGQLETNRGAPS